MAFTYGFYNSVNHDRKYDAVQMGMIFDGIITDGIYATYLKAMVVKASENASEVIVQPGRAWFNHTWSYNDSDYPIATPDPEVVLDRIDTLVLDINAEDASRSNSFLWVQGTPTSQIPEPPELIHTATHNQYPLCNVYRKAGTTQIYAADITNRVGTSDCPFVTGVLEGINIDDLLAQWDDEFHTWERATKSAFEGWMVNQQSVYTAWWDALKTQMSGDVADVEAWVQSIRGIIDSEAATHLQAEIDELNEWVPNGSYLRIVTEEQELFSRAVTISDLAGHSQTENFDANGVAIFKSFPYVGTLNIASSNGARTAVRTITVPYFTRMENIQLAFWSATVNIEADIEMAGYTVTVKDSNDATVTTVVLNANAEGIFRAQAPDTYKFQVTYGGETMEVSLAVTEETTYSVSISAGFNWRTWCEVGEVSTSGYNSLADVLADELAVHKLMTKHASSDYLIEGVSGKLSVIDDFCANDTAMKWIGLRDYVCDGLTAISGVEAKFLASQYWERYLKDHVPTMTSNNAPYGVASATSEYSSEFAAYKAFDDNTTDKWMTNAKNNARLVFKFEVPINVKCAEVMADYDSSLGAGVKNYKYQYSDDGTNFTDVDNASFVYPSQNNYKDKQLLTDSGYHLYWALFVTDTYNSSSKAIDAKFLQFYGRSLNVSVPVMTSNTAPYGVASASSAIVNANTVKAAYIFFGGITNNDSWISNNSSCFVGYTFPSPVCITAISTNISSSTSIPSATVYFEGSNNGETWDIIKTWDSWEYLVPRGFEVFENNNSYTSYRIRGTGYPEYYRSGSNNGYAWRGGPINFYGVDYSEREFEPNTNKKWLYDHGLELEPMNIFRGDVVKNDDSISLAHSSSGAASCGVNNVDLTPYSLARAIIKEFKGTYNYLMVTDLNITQSIAQRQIDNTYAPNNVNLDISSTDGVYALLVQSQQTVGNSMELNELWLE